MERGQVVADRFRIERIIGEGGVGRVYRAEDLETRQIVAIKCLRPEFAQDTRFKRRFLREARAVARLHHPNIIRMFTSGENADGLPYLTMELIDGVPLSEHRDAGLHLDSLLSVVDQTLGALAYAHARGVIHRDVKPENILVTLGVGGGLLVKLLDFGFARVEDDEDIKLTQAHGDTFGTPLYMSPEQVSGKKHQIGPETDVYAVGIILYEFITGRPPFTGAHGMAVALKHVLEPVPPMVARPGLRMPLGIEGVVNKSLEKDPRDRWRTAADLRRALTRFGIPQTSTGGDQGDLALDSTLASHPAFALPTAELPREVEAQGRPQLAALSLSGLGPLETDHRPDATEVPTRAIVVEAELVGRNADLTWLWDRAREVCDQGRGQLALLAGAPGMGRRRVVGWLRDRVAEGGWMRVLGGPQVESGGEIRGLLHSLFDGPPIDRLVSEAWFLRALSRWAAIEGGPAPEASALTSLAAALTRLWLPEDRSNERPLAAPVEIGFENLTLALRLAARERPLLLVIESLDKMPTELAEFLASLLSSLGRTTFSILVVGGFTTDDRGQARYASTHALVETLSSADAPDVRLHGLGPLSSESIRQLIRGLVGPSVIEGPVADAIARRARGNPFFARELGQYLTQAGELVDDGLAWVVSRSASPQSWPQTLAETLLKRSAVTLRRHAGGELACTVLEHSSLLGETFDYEVLITFMSRLGHDRRELEAAIELNLSCDIFVEGRIDDEGDRLGLAHGVLHEALLAQLNRSPTLPQMHEAAARARLTKRRSPDDDQLIGGHLELAGRLPEAATALSRAAAAERARGRLDVAVELLERADGLMTRVVDPGVDRLRATIWLDLGELELLRDKHAPARTLALRVYSWARQESSQGLGQSLGPSLEGRAVLLVAELFQRGGQLNEAARAYAEARVVFEHVGDDTGIGRSLMGAAFVERSLGRLEAALTLYELARRSMERCSDTVGLARASRAEGEIAERKNEIVAVRDKVERAMAAQASTDDGSGGQHRIWKMGESYRMLGELEIAAAHFEAARRQYEHDGDDGGLGRTYLSLARLHRERGLGALAEDHSVIAERHLSSAREHVRRSGDLGQETALSAALAWVAAELGDERTMELELREALDSDAQAPKTVADFAWAIEGLAEVEAHVGRRTRAAQLLTRASEIRAALGQVEHSEQLSGRADLMSARGVG